MKVKCLPQAAVSLSSHRLQSTEKDKENSYFINLGFLTDHGSVTSDLHQFPILLVVYQPVHIVVWRERERERDSNLTLYISRVNPH